MRYCVGMNKIEFEFDVELVTRAIVSVKVQMLIEGSTGIVDVFGLTPRHRICLMEHMTMTAGWNFRTSTFAHNGEWWIFQKPTGN